MFTWHGAHKYKKVEVGGGGGGLERLRTPAKHFRISEVAKNSVEQQEVPFFLASCPQRPL